MNRVLITGISGHLGLRALRMLASSNEVHAVVRGKPAAVVSGVTYHEIDLSSPWTADQLPTRMDAVIHLAQSRNYKDFPDQAFETFQVNTVATALLLDYAYRVGAARFILASTGGLYKPTESLIDEATPVASPEGVLAYYFRTKWSAELLAESYAKQMSVTILRPFFIYGPGQSDDKLIARLIASVREGRPILLAGHDGLKINPVHVDDAAELLSVLLAQDGSRTLNVAGPDVVSIRHIAEESGRLLVRSPVLQATPGRAESIVADHRAVAQLLRREMRRFNDGLRAWIT